MIFSLLKCNLEFIAFTIKVASIRLIKTMNVSGIVRINVYIEISLQQL